MTDPDSPTNGLVAIEAVRQLKYRYFRFLDGKRWDDLATCFTADATAAYDDGKYSFTGREAIIAFLRDALGSSDTVSMHHGHHPEITLVGSDRAEGIWLLEDYLIFRESGMRLHGGAIYRDRYARIAGDWKIAHTGYVRLFEEIAPQAESSRWKLTNFGAHLAPAHR